MNIFQITPSVMYVETNEDLEFVKMYCEGKGIVRDIKIGDYVEIDQNNKTYVVKPLDTIDSISKKMGVSKEQVKSKTAGGNIFIGQKIEF